MSEHLRVHNGIQCHGKVEGPQNTNGNTATRSLMSGHNNNSMALVCERTIPTKRPPHVGEVSANFCG
jgi:hypothetical protein